MAIPHPWGTVGLQTPPSSTRVQVLVQSSTLGAEEAKQPPPGHCASSGNVWLLGTLTLAAAQCIPQAPLEQAVAAQPQALHPSIWNPALLQMSLPASTGTTQTHLLLQ